MSRLGLSVLLVLAIGLATGVGVYLIQAVEEPSPPAVRPIPVPVEVVRITPGPFIHQLEALGTVQPIREAAVSVEAAGPVASVSPAIELGAPVTEGMLLAQIDPTPFRIDVSRGEAQLARAQAQVEKAEVDRERQESLLRINRDKLRLARAEWHRLADLFERELVAEQEVERTELGVRRVQEQLEVAESGLEAAKAQHAAALAEAASAEAELERARQALQDTQVRAPFAGFISEKLVTVGEQVAPGTVLFRLVDVAVVKIVVRVPADDIGLLRPGALAQVRVTGFSEPFQGRVAHVGPRADIETRTFPVEILVNNESLPRLLPGMFARASIPVRSYPAAILVPRATVVRREGAHAVFVADTERGIARRRPITITRTFGARHLIEQGLEPGDLLIVTGQHLLQDGAAIQVVETRQLKP